MIEEAAALSSAGLFNEDPNEKVSQPNSQHRIVKLPIKIERLGESELINKLVQDSSRDFSDENREIILEIVNYCDEETETDNLESISYNNICSDNGMMPDHQRYVKNGDDTNSKPRKKITIKITGKSRSSSLETHKALMAPLNSLNSTPKHIEVNGYQDDIKISSIGQSPLIMRKVPLITVAPSFNNNKNGHTVVGCNRNKSTDTFTPIKINTQQNRSNNSQQFCSLWTDEKSN
jgi:hypothetical protein